MPVTLLSPTQAPASAARPRLRRHLAAWASATLALGLLAGCAPAAEPASVGSSTEPDTTTDTIAFSYEGYEANIPANPERVVVLDSRSGLEMALLADYPIVATAYGTDSPLSPLIDDDVAHLKNSAFDLNREEIASFQPDLIVVGVGWWNYYDGEDFKLNEIAPVLAVNDGIDVAGATPEEPFAAMTDQLSLLGREDKADAAIADYETAVAEARDRVAHYTEGKIASVIHSPEDNFTVISGDSVYQVVLPALGMQILDNKEISSAPANQNGDGHMLSYESAVSALGDADLLFVFKADAGTELEPLLKRVPAVERGDWIDGNLAERFGFALTYTSFVTGVADAVEQFPDFTPAA
ncbi:Ferrichrome-binding periplasmic protein precursor (TC 3.A.1.14.3) [Leucobacter sp. 7(1)]|uniref:ABC transporter substrate-binding protein n=1 Tax=Leucobacter sp. 7(1) TaxID=1255613 RepID=UPI00097E80A4|nr:ABC transporter substrate-binding protein [Leucobacter sp. 7(1)]SJN12481.1 Ferrichrome-binding periplasmic protein precursor (TC 3.A.1.14.3) [Leucobacter sp. 7(1)]